MFIIFVLLFQVLEEEEEFLGGDVGGYMESLLVILLGLVEVVSNIYDLVLAVEFLESPKCKSPLELRLIVSFCFFCIRDDGSRGFGVIVRVWISFGGEVEVEVDVEV